MSESARIISGSDRHTTEPTIQVHKLATKTGNSIGKSRGRGVHQPRPHPDRVSPGGLRGKCRPTARPVCRYRGGPPENRRCHALLDPDVEHTNRDRSIVIEKLPPSVDRPHHHRSYGYERSHGFIRERTSTFPSRNSLFFTRDLSNQWHHRAVLDETQRFHLLLG